MTDVLPCEDGQAQERSLFGALRETIQPRDLWRADRTFCTCALLCDIDQRGACFIIRQHEGLPFEPVNVLRSVGRIETGHVAEQRVQVRDAQGGTPLFRRIRVLLDPPTRNGDRVLYILPNVPLRKASTKRVARVLSQALDAGDRLPAPRRVLPFGNQDVGLSQGRLVRFLLGSGRLPHGGRGDGGVTQRAWCRAY